MMAEAYSLSVWPSSLALESELSRNLESHTGLVPRLSHHEWKNLKNNPFGMNVLYVENGFLGFSFFKCEIPEGLMVGQQALHRGACSPGENMQTQHQRRQSHT